MPYTVLLWSVPLKKRVWAAPAALCDGVETCGATVTGRLARIVQASRNTKSLRHQVWMREGESFRPTNPR